MNTLSVFAKNNKDETPKFATKCLRHNNHIGTNEEVVKCWESKEKFDLTYYMHGSSDEFGLVVCVIYELDNGDVVIMTDNSYMQQNDYFRMDYKSFIGKLTVTETRILFKGDDIK